MNTVADLDCCPHWLHTARRAVLVLITLAWAVLAAAGAASADDDDGDDDDDDSTSSSVITTWPPATVEWPPQLEGAGDASSDTEVPIVMPGGRPLLPPAPVTTEPAEPIVPILIPPAPEATSP